MTSGVQLVRSADRFATDWGWLDSRHSFSFGQHYDANNTGFGVLLVSNEDVVAPGAGFETHPHRDMEILTWVLEGALTHADSIGNGAPIRPGEVQVMSAGTGILHSEHNHSDARTHLLQIWIRPDRHGLAPRYDHRTIDRAAMHNQLAEIAGAKGGTGLVSLHQDVRILAADLEPETAIEHTLRPGRGLWIQVTKGAVRLGNLVLQQGDGAAVEGEPAVRLTAMHPAQVLLFDLH